MWVGEWASGPPELGIRSHRLTIGRWNRFHRRGKSKIPWKRSLHCHRWIFAFRSLPLEYRYQLRNCELRNMLTILHCIISDKRNHKETFLFWINIWIRFPLFSDSDFELEGIATSLRSIGDTRKCLNDFWNSFPVKWSILTWNCTFRIRCLVPETVSQSLLDLEALLRWKPETWWPASSENGDQVHVHSENSVNRNSCLLTDFMLMIYESCFGKKIAEWTDEYWNQSWLFYSRICWKLFANWRIWSQELIFSFSSFSIRLYLNH